MRAIVLFFTLCMTTSCFLKQDRGIVNMTSISDTTHVDTTGIGLYIKLTHEISELKGYLRDYEVKDSSINKEFDELQKDLIKSQGVVIKLHAVKINLDNFIVRNKELLSKISELSKRYESLRDSSVVIATQLQSERMYSKRVVSERNKKQAIIDNASKLDLVSVSVRAFGIPKKAVFWNTNRFETIHAKQVKQVVIYFTIPPNKICEPRVVSILGVIYGTVGVPEDKKLQEIKDIHYDCNEHKDSLVFDNKDVLWRASRHSVKLFSNNQFLDSCSLILK